MPVPPPEPDFAEELVDRAHDVARLAAAHRAVGFAYLSGRSVQVASKDGRKAGAINSTTAVPAVAVVDKAGQTK